MNDVMLILSALEWGDPQAAKKLLPLVCDEIRKRATVPVAPDRPGQTLQPTALASSGWLGGTQTA
jgi:hypothetical protein